VVSLVEVEARFIDHSKRETSVPKEIIPQYVSKNDGTYVSTSRWMRSPLHTTVVFAAADTTLLKIPKKAVLGIGLNLWNSNQATYLKN